MEIMRVEYTAGGRILAVAKIQKGIFQRDALSPLLFIIDMMPLNQTHRKCTAGYNLSRSQKKINHLMNMDSIKLFEKQLSSRNLFKGIITGAVTLVRYAGHISEVEQRRT